MRPVLLIAANLLREARWYVAVMAVWVIGLALIVQLDKRPKPDDVLFIVRQEAGYGIALALMMGAAAIHGDRKTRRILSILSKAVERRQYLAGLLLGSAYQALIFLLTVGICGSWMAYRLGLPIAPLWMFLVPPFFAAVLAAAAGLMCASFLHPLFATAVSGLLVAGQYWLERDLAPGSQLLPMQAVIQSFFTFQFQPDWPLVIAPCAAALLEATVFWFVASLIFERRDIAVAVD
jgi:hypothetical protein